MSGEIALRPRQAYQFPWHWVAVRQSVFVRKQQSPDVAQLGS